MTHPMVAARTDRVREAVAYVQAHGATYETEPEATAVVDVFLDKLRQLSSQADAVPLKDLVTPETWSAWHRQIDDQKERTDLLVALQFYQLLMPKVYPESDGVVGVRLAWQHPDQTATEVIDQPRLVMGHMAYVENVPRVGWRLRNIE